MDKELQELKTKHDHECEDFLDFLDRTNTEDGISELGVQEVLQNKCRDIMKELSKRNKEIKRQELKQLNNYHIEVQVYLLDQMLESLLKLGVS